jgi:CRISPR-associated protein Cmr4
MFKQAKILFLYTETPLHVGSGSSLGTVDLPIQRERHTNLPMIQGSGIKGKLRSSFEPDGVETLVSKVIFGHRGAEHAGALSPGDARILLFPVRSLSGVFAWITCPLVISRFMRDLQLASQAQSWKIPSVTGQNAYIPSGSTLSIGTDLVLEEFSFTANSTDTNIAGLANWLSANALPATPEYQFWRDKLKKDLVVISDDAFKDFCQFSTDVVARTKIDSVSKTVETGALWTEENLPSDSLLYTPLFASDPRMDNKPDEVPDATSILDIVSQHLSNGHSHLQLGGNETVGRGLVATRVLGFNPIVKELIETSEPEGINVDS